MVTNGHRPAWVVSHQTLEGWILLSTGGARGIGKMLQDQNIALKIGGPLGPTLKGNQSRCTGQEQGSPGPVKAIQRKDAHIW
jgi:hypothetical protein